MIVVLNRQRYICFRKIQLFTTFCAFAIQKKTVEINEKLSQNFPECTFVRSSKIALDIMPSGVNKATAVSFLCNQWNIDIKDTMAFGDNYNDCEMLEAVGHGIVMGNAPDNIKNRFSEVTLDNNHDGISFTLSKYKIIWIVNII